MGEIEEKGKIILRELAKLDDNTREAIVKIAKKIGECCDEAEKYHDLIFELQPEILFEPTTFSGEILDETRKYIDNYNLVCDKTATLIGMIPVKAIRDVFKWPEKIPL